MRATAYAFALALLIGLFPAIGAAQPAAAPQPPSLADDALTAPPPSSAGLASSLDARGPSQFMAGDVAVLMVLPESNGAIDPSTEDWTPAQIEAVRAEVQGALDWWARMLPLAGLHFHLKLQVVPTSYEPTRHGLTEEGLWIGDTLRQLGFNGSSYFEQAYAATAAVRDEFNADWSTVLFVPNSFNGNGSLSDGRFAYAYINGPLLVVTSDAGGYGTDDLDAVVAHELGHTFGALDQYPAARVSCDRRSGYLNTPTTNSQFGNCGTRLPSIMLDATGAFAISAIDSSALHQIGYRDSDGDSVIDPLDTAPVLEVAAQRLASGTGRPVISGSAYDVAFPSVYQPDVTLNTIAAVEYRVDGGIWLPAQARDGRFNSAAEEFSAELPVYDGSYSVEIRATNSAGAGSPLVTRTVQVTSMGPAPVYAASAAAELSSGTVSLRLSAPPTTAAVQVSESAGFEDAAWQPVSPELSYTLSAGDGPRSIYVRFQDQFAFSSLPIAVSVILDTQAPLGTATRRPTEATRLLLSATDASTAVTDIEVTVGAAAPRWLGYAEALDLPDATADRIVSVRFRDAAGNVSAPTLAQLGYTVSLPLLHR